MKEMNLFVIYALD